MKSTRQSVCYLALVLTLSACNSKKNDEVSGQVNSPAQSTTPAAAGSGEPKSIVERPGAAIPTATIMKNLENNEINAELNLLAAILFEKVKNPENDEKYFSSVEDAKKSITKLFEVLKGNKYPIFTDLLAETLNEHLDQRFVLTMTRGGELDANGVLLSSFKTHPEIVLPRYLELINQTDPRIWKFTKDGLSTIGDTGMATIRGFMNFSKTFNAEGLYEAGMESVNPDTAHGRALITYYAYVLKPVINVSNSIIEAGKTAGGYVGEKFSATYEGLIKKPGQVFSLNGLKIAADEIANPDAWYGKTLMVLNDYIIQPAKSTSSEIALNVYKNFGAMFTIQGLNDAGFELLNPDAWYGKTLLAYEQYVGSNIRAFIPAMLNAIDTAGKTVITTPLNYLANGKFSAEEMQMAGEELVNEERWYGQAAHGYNNNVVQPGIQLAKKGGNAVVDAAVAAKTNVQNGATNVANNIDAAVTSEGLKMAGEELVNEEAWYGKVAHGYNDHVVKPVKEFLGWLFDDVEEDKK